MRALEGQGGGGFSGGRGMTAVKNRPHREGEATQQLPPVAVWNLGRVKDEKMKI